MLNSELVVIGCGVVGLATGKAFSRAGLGVSYVDSDPTRISIARSEGLRVSEGLDVLTGRTVVILASPTSVGDDGYDLTDLKVAAETVGDAISSTASETVIAVRSKVPPGTADSLIKTTIAAWSGKVHGADFHVASNPWFPWDTAITPDRGTSDGHQTVVGSTSPVARQVLRELYSKLGDVRVFDDPRIVELFKVTHSLIEATSTAIWTETKVNAEAFGTSLPDIGPFFDALEIASSGSPDERWRPSQDARTYLEFVTALGLRSPLARAVVSAEENRSERERTGQGEQG